jgi:hypothetical protein
MTKYEHLVENPFDKSQYNIKQSTEYTVYHNFMLYIRFPTVQTTICINIPIQNILTDYHQIHTNHLQQYKDNL